MLAPASFDYAIIRVVPHVDRGECMNVGAIVFCRTRRFLESRIELDEARLTAFAPWLDLDEVRRHLAVFPLVCRGGRDAGPIGRLPLAERWHWLVAPRSTIVQVGPVHSGRSVDPAAALNHLITTMVRPLPGAESGATSPLNKDLT
jgi:hypothetical protein